MSSKKHFEVSPRQKECEPFSVQIMVEVSRITNITGSTVYLFVHFVHETSLQPFACQKRCVSFLRLAHFLHSVRDN